jgi:hypothetical protein
MPPIIRQMLEQYAPSGLKALDQLEHGDEEIAALKAERDRWMEQAMTQSKLYQSARAVLEKAMPFLENPLYSEIKRILEGK